MVYGNILHMFIAENSKIREHKDVEIYGKTYKVFYNEFNKINHTEYSNLKLYNEIGIFERIIGLIKKIKECFDEEVKFISYDTTHGGFIPINLQSSSLIFSNNSLTSGGKTLFFPNINEVGFSSFIFSCSHWQ